MSNQVAPFNPPAAQRHILLTTQFGYHMIQKRSNYRTYVGSTTGIVNLFPVAEKDEDYAIFPGELLYAEKQGLRRRRTIFEQGQSQQPFVLSSLNGLSTTKSELAKMPGLTQKEKTRNWFKKNFQVIGPSLKCHLYAGGKAASVDEPVALLGGVTHMYNGSKYDWYPMDYLCWDIPDEQTNMPADKTGFSTIHPSTRKLVGVPLRLAFEQITSDNLFKYVHATPHNTHKFVRDEIDDQDALDQSKMDYFDQAIECDQKRVFESFARLQTLFALVTSKFNQANVENEIKNFDAQHGGNAKVADTDKETKIVFTNLTHACLHSEAIREQLQNVFDAIRGPELEARSRIYAKVLRGSQPGERSDTLGYH